MGGKIFVVEFRIKGREGIAVVRREDKPTVVYWLFDYYLNTTVNPMFAGGSSNRGNNTNNGTSSSAENGNSSGSAGNNTSNRNNTNNSVNNSNSINSNNNNNTLPDIGTLPGTPIQITLR